MAKKIKITEQQYNQIMDEGITLKADLDAAGGDANRAIEKTKEDAKNSGVNLQDASIEIPANESKIITIKKLNENRINFLKKNSTLYSINDFLYNMNK